MDKRVKISIFLGVLMVVILSSTFLVSYSYYINNDEDGIINGSFDILGLYDVIITIYKEDNSGTKVKNGISYKRVTSIPNNAYQNYRYYYECKRDDVTTTFTYDVNLNKLVMNTDGKNLCMIYFYENTGDVFLNVYVNNVLVNEYTGNHTLNTYYCEDLSGNRLVEGTDYSISYSNASGIELETKITSKCYVYLN